MNLPEEQWFYFKDGAAVKNLNELKGKIEEISYDEFYHHVNEYKNDFANWIRYVLKDEQLATMLEKVDSIVETVEILDDYLYPKPGKMHRGDDIQERIEEELHIEIPKPQEEAPRQPIPQEMPQAPEPETGQDEDRTAAQEDWPGTSRHYHKLDQERDEIEQFHHDVGKVIVKDFIIGLLFGIVIGYILGRAFIIV